MTYNFDPDRWYENEYRALQHQYTSGKLTKEALDKALEQLQHRYDEMWDRLSHSYQIPRFSK